LDKEELANTALVDIALASSDIALYVAPGGPGSTITLLRAGVGLKHER
jgi:hypothetical protein